MLNEDEMYFLLLMQMSAALIATAFLATRRKQRQPRRWWVRPIYQMRQQQGDYHNLVQEMRLNDIDMFFHYTRMTTKQFDNLLAIVGPHLMKISHRVPLNPEHRLLITLRFLATGSSQQTLAFQFRVGKLTVSKVLSETTLALWNSLKGKVFPKFTPQSWLKIADEYEKKWNFPHCVGALDGKHFRIQCPSNSGSEWFNYKKFFSMVLLAVCDGDYKFTVIDIGGLGSESDGGYFARSQLGRLLEKNELNLPKPSKLPNNEKFPYVIVADEAFPLKNYLMRPFPGQNLTRKMKIFNYRLSRARRIIENSFGILVSRWRLFQGPIIAKLENIENYILASICLHNFLRIDESKMGDSERKYCSSKYTDSEGENGVILGEWRSQIFDSQFYEPIPRTGSNNAKRMVFQLRNELADYFVSPEGAVSWQQKHIERGIKRKRINP